MSDLFGLLPLPAPAPKKGEALTDPTLDILLSYLQAVANYDLGKAWAVRAPVDPKPVAHVFPHDPDLENFESSKTPSLYLWRAPDSGRDRYAQDFLADEGGFQGLWVPPEGSQEQRADRQPFRNGLKKAFKRALAQGRHPGWVLEGDDYFSAQEFGSVLLPNAGLARVRLGQFRPHELIIEPYAGGSKSSKMLFDCLFFTIEALELTSTDPDSGGVPLHCVEGTIRLAPRPNVDDPDQTLLPMVSPGQTLTYHLVVGLASILPTSGAAAGGTTVLLDGTQFQEDSTIAFGSDTAGWVDSPYVVSIDESTYSARTPAHAAGIVSVRITSPSGETAVLEDAFTFT